MRVARVATVAALALSLAFPVFASDPVENAVPARNAITVSLTVDRWPDIEGVEFVPEGADVSELGGFSEGGYGFEAAYARRTPLKTGHMLEWGGEFGAFWNEGRGETVLIQPDGRTARRRIGANAGYLTASVRWHVATGRQSSVFVGAGAGMYLIVIKESIEDWTADFDISGEAPGGYLCGGLDVGLAESGKTAIRVEARAHAFSFSESEFQGQELGGPLYALHLGLTWRF
ncbi:MAG: hypothetical protein KBD01_17295 [Acidobacteria bacterium]|nr:hypothetical protein [Acidobacteriota bacterium]